MSLGEDPYDRLAHALSESEFDAVEHDGLRAAWTDDGTTVVVETVDGGERVEYNGEDLVRATSDRELGDAREPEAASES